MRVASVFVVLGFMATSASADAPPRVVVDIPPVHSLVSQVMAGVGMPDLVTPVGATPHAHALRPSEASALQAADLLIWIGPELSPWLAGPVLTLAASAEQLTLLDHPTTEILAFREGVSFEDHDHDHDHDEDAGQGGADPHAWLDPQNVIRWLPVIAEVLSVADPENAALYAANAQAAQLELIALDQELAAQLAGLSGQFVVFHDAYHYFEARFGLSAAGAISLSDAAPPSPARMAGIRDHVAAAAITCVFVEPQFNRGLVDAVFESGGMRIGVLDPLGASFAPGPDLYAEILRAMAGAFEQCLQGE